VISFSVIIPFKKNNKYLIKCLDSFNKIQDIKFEVILLPDNKIDLENNYNFKIRVIETGKISPPHKRDLGIKNTKTDYIFFIDDDAFPSTDIFHKATEIFTNNPKLDCLVGPAITPEEDNDFGHLTDIFFSSIFGGGFPDRYKLSNKKYNVSDWPTVNFFIKRESFNLINGFNTNIWPGEDTIFCEKLVKNNMSILYYGKLIVYHFRRTNWKKHLNQISNYGFQRGFLFKKKLTNSLNIKYLLPTIFLFCTLFSLLNIYYLNWKFFIFNLVTLVYLIIIVIISLIKKKNILNLFLVFFLSHIFYGIYFMKGLFGKKNNFLKQL